MPEIRSPFYAFRYMVTPFERQTSLIHEWEALSKEELMHKAFADLSSEPKVSFIHGKKRFLFFSITSYRERLFVYNFAKELKGVKAVEGATDIELVEDERLKHIMLFVHTGYQIILIERKTTAFQNMNAVLRHLEWYLRDRMRTFHYTVNLYPLAKSERFWETINSADGIYELSLTVNAPNLFGGSQNLREVLQEIKDETNNDETTLEIKSTEGKLKVEKSVFGHIVEYIATIGGKYFLKYKKEGVTENRNNLDDNEKTHIVRHKDREYTEEELSDVEVKMKLIDGRTNEDNKDEKKQ